MNLSFRNAATAADADFKSASDSSSLTITSDWQGTLCADRKYNYPLFVFLSDAHKAGHRVIITSTSPADAIRDLVELAAEFGEIEGHDIAAINNVEIITKTDVMKMTTDGTLKVDIAFDDEEISTQEKFSFAAGGHAISLNYARPTLEVRVLKDFSTTPVTMSALEATVGALVKEKINPSSSGPQPH